MSEAPSSQATPPILDRFVQLFRGRSDCYGAWGGGCVKEQLTKNHFRNHLNHGPFVGVYPLIGDRVTWGCIDIDGKQHAVDVSANLWDWDTMRAIARNLVAALAYKDVTAHTEKTDNGIHVWVFPEEPLVAAATMRRTLMAACKVVGYDPKEVNPKQEKLGHGQVGNYVRLPYPGGVLSLPTSRYFYDVDGSPIELDHFIDVAEAARTPTATLEQVAQLWTPPTTDHTLNTDAGLSVENILPLLGGLAYRIWKQGPLEGSDRSNTLAKLAYQLAEDGLVPDAAFLIVKSADERWGKFHSRVDCDQQLARLIERAYAE